MPNNNFKSLDFYTGPDSVKESLYSVDDLNLLKRFLLLFEHSDDKYYAISLFEEKPKLVISKYGFDFFSLDGSMIYKDSNQVYNLFVKEDPDFFIEILSSLQRLKFICTSFGFDYELDESGDTV
jgi:hypothetical protein